MRLGVGIVATATATVLLTFALVPTASNATKPAVSSGATATAPAQVPMLDEPVQPPVTELIVRYKPGVKPTQAPGVATGDDAVDNVDLEPGRKMSVGLRTVTLGDPLDVQDAQSVARELEQDPRIESATPNLRMFPTRDVLPESATDPDDPLFQDGSLWGLDGVYGIDGPTAWGVTTGSSSVVVAVLDTGIATHTELPGSSQVSGYDMVSDVDSANDETARDSNPADPGDWVTELEASTNGGPFYGCDVDTSSWHGTHVAGTIGAVSDNGSGVASVAPGVKIEPVRVLGKCGGSYSDIIDGITWAAGGHVSGVPDNPNPAAVINMSLGGPGTCDSGFQDAIDGAVALGTTVVVAAGNEDLSASWAQPASCNNVVTVGATGTNGRRASFSNWGAPVDLAAPGVGIWSTANTGTQGPEAQTYASYSGTSMATPHVAGLAGLLKSHISNLTPAQVEARLKQFTKTFPQSACDASPSKTCGTGIANASALTGVIPVAPVVPEPVTPPSKVQNLRVSYKRAKATVKWTAPADNGGAAILGYYYRISKNNGKTWMSWKWPKGTQATLVRKAKLKYSIQVLAFNSAGQGPTTTRKIKRR